MTEQARTFQLVEVGKAIGDAALNALLVIVVIAVVVLIAVEDRDPSTAEITRYSLMIGIPLVAKVLVAIGAAISDMGPQVVLLFLCLPIGVFTWLSAQVFSVSPQLRDGLMSLGSALTGVFLAHLPRLLGATVQNERTGT